MLSYSLSINSSDFSKIDNCLVSIAQFAVSPQFSMRADGKATVLKNGRMPCVN